ncbi:unnamed protein product [Leuciscus chuanchicus]
MPGGGGYLLVCGFLCRNTGIPSTSQSPHASKSWFDSCARNVKAPLRCVQLHKDDRDKFALKGLWKLQTRIHHSVKNQSDESAFMRAPVKHANFWTISVVLVALGVSGESSSTGVGGFAATVMKSQQPGLRSAISCAKREKKKKKKEQRKREREKETAAKASGYWFVVMQSES